MYDYGELSDGDMMPTDNQSQIQMSNLDMLEQKVAQDKEIINGAIDEFIQDKKNWFRDLNK